MQYHSGRIVGVAFALATFMIGVSSSARSQSRTFASDCNRGAPIAAQTVKLPGHPYTTVTTRDGCWLFVSLTSDDVNANGVATLRNTNGQITVEHIYPLPAREGRDALRPGPSSMAITHDDQVLIAANDDYVWFLDVKALIAGGGNPILGRISDDETAVKERLPGGAVLALPGSVYVNVMKTDAYVFVCDEFAATITVIDLNKARHNRYDRSAIVGKIPVGRAPAALTFSPDERWLYTTSGAAADSWNWPAACPRSAAGQGADRQSRDWPEGAVLVVDVRRAVTDPAHAVVAKTPAGCLPIRLAISPSGDTVWAAARNSDAVLAFDTSKLLTDPLHARIGSVPVGSQPVPITVLPDGKHVLVGNSNKYGDSRSTQDVTVIDIERVRASESAVVGSIRAGIFPREFGRSPDGRTLFLANFLSNTVQVIDATNVRTIEK